MKVIKKNSELCIACHECESTCANTWFKETDIEKSSIRIEENGDEINIITCTQCGECIDVCQTQAITRDKNGIVRINKKMCVGCFMCVGFCPEIAMIMHKDMIEPFKCVACGQCVKVCSAGAISMSDEG